MTVPRMAHTQRQKATRTSTSTRGHRQSSLLVLEPKPCTCSSLKNLISVTVTESADIHSSKPRRRQSSELEIAEIEQVAILVAH